jgi:Mg-chelatase subunit ChlD
VTSLPDGAVFNLVGFANAVQVWRPDPTVRSAKTAAAALEWVAKRDVLGATNIYDALETAFELMGAGTAKDRAVEPVYDTVFFMTDGRPTSGKVTDPDRILAEVRRWNAARRVRLHVVGMGGHEKTNPDGGEPEDDVDPAFLKRLAEENGGQCVLR